MTTAIPRLVTTSIPYLADTTKPTVTLSDRDAQVMDYARILTAPRDDRDVNTMAGLSWAARTALRLFVHLDSARPSPVPPLPAVEPAALHASARSLRTASSIHRARAVAAAPCRAEHTICSRMSYSGRPSVHSVTTRV